MPKQWDTNGKSYMYNAEFQELDMFVDNSNTQNTLGANGYTETQPQLQMVEASQATGVVMGTYLRQIRAGF